MQLWKKLYNAVRLAFLSCLLIPHWLGSVAGLLVHALLGLAMLIVTCSNARRLEALPVPSRLKRISKAVPGFAVLQLVSGLALGAIVTARQKSAASSEAHAAYLRIQAVIVNIISG